MKPAQLLLAYQRQVERERALRSEIERVTQRLSSDPEVAELEHELAGAKDAQAAAAANLRDSDRTREAHRSDLHSRERLLMSGRVRNPTELMQMSVEVEGMRSRFVEEEEAELRLMEEAEIADSRASEIGERLESTRRRSTAEEPGLRTQLNSWIEQLSEVEKQRAELWAQVPPQAQTAYQRVRVQPAIAEVLNNQCTVCRVGVTSSGMQVLRKGDELLNCDHCGRILVLA